MRTKIDKHVQNQPHPQIHKAILSELLDNLHSELFLNFRYARLVSQYDGTTGCIFPSILFDPISGKSSRSLIHRQSVAVVTHAQLQTVPESLTAARLSIYVKDGFLTIDDYFGNKIWRFTWDLSAPTDLAEDLIKLLHSLDSRNYQHDQFDTVNSF